MDGAVQCFAFVELARRCCAGEALLMRPLWCQGSWLAGGVYLAAPDCQPKGSQMPSDAFFFNSSSLQESAMVALPCGTGS
jgi:hypothetical protein